VAEKITIALDAMGGDKAPEIIIGGADLARERHSNTRYIFFGDEPTIKPCMDQYPKLSAISEICHTETIVASSDKPSAALRAGRKSSMGLSIKAVHDGLAAGVVSAGNTGALMALSKIILGMIPGIIRPAIASILPTKRGESVMLDLGANTQCNVEHLVQFAIMGEVFARTAMGVLKPKVGLLNIGIEDLKGTESIRQAAAILKRMASDESNLPIQFHGFVEGFDVPYGTVDVVVTDGFSGNVCLKTVEGTAKLYSAFIKESFKHSFWAKLGFLFARPAFNRLRQRADPRRYNGALFLGVNGVSVKSHGGTDAYGFATAVGLTADMIAYGFVDKVREEIEQISHLIFSKSVT
jgi:phosphate acyltransferase